MYLLKLLISISMYMYIKLIVAHCNNRGIGLNNSIPWHYSKDMTHFKKTTIGNGNNAIVMGKNTYNSIGKTLPNRLNIIISSTLKNDNLNIVNSLEDAIIMCNNHNIHTLWIIGGEKLYTYALVQNLPSEIWTTYIKKDYDCDVFLNPLPLNYQRSTTLDISDDIMEFKIYHAS